MEVIQSSNLWVNQIFKSISGEVGGFPQGSICGFLRLAGCNISCTFCDAKESQDRKNGKEMSISTILATFKSMKTRQVVITGGEPLIQARALKDLIKVMQFLRYRISVETNGTLKVPTEILDSKVTIVMDYKLDMPDKMDLHHFVELKDTDYIKFVISNRDDLEKAIEIQKKLYLSACPALFAYSPMLPIQKRGDANGLMNSIHHMSNLIIERLSKSSLPAILNLQLHKIVGVD